MPTSRNDTPASRCPEVELIGRGIARVDWLSGLMLGTAVKGNSRVLGQLPGVFRDVQRWREMDPDTLVYRVQWVEPVRHGTEGGLFCGSTVVQPGRVGDEYFMTHGHFHAKRDRAEFYSTIQGQGMLILTDERGSAWTEALLPGSLHYVGARIAHRIANTGNTPLAVFACWPSDAGHDYETIRENGFAVRLICDRGMPTLVEGA
jgi:glucose-6-phosphate isomerase